MHAPPHTPPSRGPRLWTAGGRELRLKSRPPAHLVSLSNNQRLRTLQRTETQKQPSHRVTPLLAQRIPLSGNSYFWRTARRAVEDSTGSNPEQIPQREQ